MKTMEDRKREFDKLLKVAHEVIEGKWGNGLQRIKLLETVGYDSAKVQNIVNVLMMEQGR